MRSLPTAPPTPEAARRARGRRVASAVSYFLNPLALPPVTFGVVQLHFGGSTREVAWTVGVSLVFFAVLPLLYIVGMIRRGEAESLEVRAQASRTRAFVAFAASYAVGLLVLRLTVHTAMPLVVSLAGVFPVNTAVLMLINLRWKISIHMAALAAFCSMLLFVALADLRLPAAPEAALTVASVAPLLLLVPVLMWARVRVGAHSPGQVVAGALFGLLVPFVELYLLAYYVLARV